MLTPDSFLSVTLLAVSTLTTLLFSYLYVLKRQVYMLWWAVGWFLLAVHYAIPLAGSYVSHDSAWSVALLALRPVSVWMLGLAAIEFLGAARAYAQLPQARKASLAAALLFAAWVVSHQQKWIDISPYIGAGLLFFLVAAVFWQESRKQESLAERLLSFAIVLWGLMMLALAFREQMTPNFNREIQFFLVVPQMFTVVLVVMAFYEEEKRRVERNMLALSNLNLTTSSFVGGEIQKMLSQALERVLSVARIPCGALFLHHGDPNGPTSVVALGLSDSFCQAAQEEGLDDHLVSMVARIGGISIFHQLQRDDKWNALADREPSFRRFRELALAQRLNTVAGISLQAKERVFGLLLLGDVEARRFTPAELRLLLALGHQIGMAVENSYLIQQTARRTEELHIMNEIGRALSSTLDLEALFDKIYAEIERLFDVTSFYIAYYDAPGNTIDFKMEVNERQRVPERSRPAGNHLTEYIIRTQQPVLIRENFVQEVRRLGCEPMQSMGSFCGVPLVLHDRGIGAMAVHSMQDRAFDEGHLELMRVLASEASIAIENARLFSEQQERSQQLALVNDISRHAISTLNPEEMLANIGHELESGLSYDHIGIGLLDYTAKEVVIHADAGRRHVETSALGMRIPFGEKLVGHVARTGEPCTTTELLAARGHGAVQELATLSESQAAIAMPMVYGEQLQGVFYVEMASPHVFSESEIRLLRTLADLISSALHNATTYQKAQEQAITDGLTGVKTHRYFMEALSAEWKRATRAGRSFSLVLMDLDRFKYVNDFYGHLEGDLVLQKVAEVLEQNCRSSDVVARYGGDEFVVLMAETNIEQGRQIAQKLRAWIDSEPLLHEKNITASFGVASFPTHGSTPQELIQMADASMYISKHQGGNTVTTADHREHAESKKWKRDVLEAYIGVTLKRTFTTGPDAFDEIFHRLEQFAESLRESQVEGSRGTAPLLLSNVPAAVVETVTSLALAIDAKNPFTQGHSPKVAAYAVILCRALGLTDLETDEVRLAALLHDVGKVGIPEAILNKSGPLDAHEWEVMKTHAVLGARLLEAVHSIGGVQRIVKHHHEYFDGSGYPDGHAGKQIPLGARIVAIADAFDTITSERTYKKARSAEDALMEIERMSGAQFDPEFVKIFVRTMRQRGIMLVKAGDPTVEAMIFRPIQAAGAGSEAGSASTTPSASD